MLRSLCYLSIFGIVLLATTSVRAQTPAGRSDAPSLGERLEQFGRDLFGGSDEQMPAAPSRAANRKFGPPDRELTADRRAEDRPTAAAPIERQLPPERTSSRRRVVQEEPNIASRTPAGEAPTLSNEESMSRPPRSASGGFSNDRVARRPSATVRPETVESRTTAPLRRGSIPLRRSEEEPTRVRLADDEPQVTRTPSEPRRVASDSAELSPTRAGRSLEERLAAAREIRPLGDALQEPASNTAQPTPAQPTPAQPTPAKPTPAPQSPARTVTEAQPTPAAPVERVAEPTPAAPERVLTSTPSEPERPAAAPLVSETPTKPAAPARPLESPAAPEANDSRRSVASTVRNNDVLVARQSPVIGIETAGPRSIKIGEPASFRVVMRNAGQVAGEGVVAEVLVPEWTEVVSTHASLGSARVVRRDDRQMVVEWTLGRLASQGREELELQIVPRKSEPFELAVQWKQSPILSQTQVEVQEPKLELKVNGPDETLYGREETYELVIANPGTGDAENVVVRLVAAGPTEENAATHPVGTVTAGETKVVEIELTAREAGEFWIKAEGAADGGLSASTAEMVLVRRAELQVEISGPQFQYAGTPAEYVVRVANRGNAPARDVEIKTVLPSGLRHVESSQRGRVDVQPGQLVWSLEGLPAGEQREFTLTCDLTAAGELRSEVLCRAADDLNATAAVTTTVEALADLVLEVSDPQGPVAVGVDATYEIRIHNRGTSGAQHIDLAAFFSEGIEPVDAGPHEHQLAAGQVVFKPIPELGAGETIVLEVHARAEASGNHAFRAELTCEPLGTKLAAQEMTRFYDSGQATRSARE